MLLHDFYHLVGVLFPNLIGTERLYVERQTTTSLTWYNSGL
jgi:hypothetical protein